MKYSIRHVASCVEATAANMDGGAMNGPLGRRIGKLRADLYVVATSHGFSNIRVFGSVARGEEQTHSDVDLLLDPPPDGVGLLGIARLQRDVEELLGARIDIVLNGELPAAVAERVRRESVAL